VLIIVLPEEVPPSPTVPPLLVSVRATGELTVLSATAGASPPPPPPQAASNGKTTASSMQAHRDVSKFFRLLPLLIVSPC
jgi:hypothetical protein